MCIRYHSSHSTDDTHTQSAIALQRFKCITFDPASCRTASCMAIASAVLAADGAVSNVAKLHHCPTCTSLIRTTSTTIKMCWTIRYAVGQSRETLGLQSHETLGLRCRRATAPSACILGPLAGTIFRLPARRRAEPATRRRLRKQSVNDLAKKSARLHAHNLAGTATARPRTSRSAISSDLGRPRSSDEGGSLVHGEEVAQPHDSRRALTIPFATARRLERPEPCRHQGDAGTQTAVCFKVCGY